MVQGTVICRETDTKGTGRMWNAATEEGWAYLCVLTALVSVFSLAPERGSGEAKAGNSGYGREGEEG